MNEIGQIGALLIGLGFFLLILWIISTFTSSKSWTYRKYLVNMLVAGKIRQLATTENINLSDEDKFFSAYCKKSGIERMSDIDNTIEAGLKEKVEKKNEEK